MLWVRERQRVQTLLTLGCSVYAHDAFALAFAQHDTHCRNPLDVQLNKLPCFVWSPVNWIASALCSHMALILQSGTYIFCAIPLFTWLSTVPVNTQAACTLVT